ncbi:MAG TPA: response regulator [Bryobacteraceae bacterium]|nr:response regulator [Bryobacteraceae bacterium]
MPRTILIVDDTFTCGDTLALALAALPDCDVQMVGSAQEALKVASTVQLAAIVTDLHMPRIDGFELIRRIRLEARFAAVPILVISGDSDAETPARVRTLGANAFFTKPFSPNAVRQTLEQLLYEKKP